MKFSSFKQSFITEVSQFKSDFVCKKSTRNDENTTEKLLHQMEKEITFLHEELKIKNTIITLLLENVKYKLKIIITMKTGVSIVRKKNTGTTQSIETVEIESVNRTIKQIVNDSDARSRKSNQLHTGHKLSNLNDTETSQNKGGTNQKKALTV